MRDMAATGLVLAGASQVRMFGTTFDDVGGQHEGFDRPLTALVVQGNAHLTVEDGVLSANPGGALEVAEGGALVMRRVRVERNGGWTHTSIGGSGTAIVQDSTFAGNEGTLFVGGQATLGLASSELSGSGGYGLVVTVGAAATVVDSVITDNGEDGVWVDGNAFLDLRTTVVRGSRVGVWVSGEARAALSGNDLHDNDGAGVAVVGSARAELLGNAFARSPVGVLLQDEGGVQGSENVFAEVGQQMMDAR